MSTDIRNMPMSDLNPVAYIVVDYNQWVMADWSFEASYEVRDEDAWKRYEDGGRAGNDSFKCDCCGHRLIYACVIEHTPTGAFYHIGRDCYANVECLKAHNDWVSLSGDRLSVRLAAAKKAAAARKAGDIREQQFFAASPDMVAVFDFAANPPIAPEHPSFHKIAWAVSTLRDLRRNVRHRGLSEKQFAFARKLHAESLEKIEQDRVRAEQAAAAIAAGVRAPEGRVAVEGVIVSTKWVENDFGGSTKCLVDFGNGTRAWGTLPSSYAGGKGDRVRFRASFELSEKDPLFAFFKRPSNWEYVEEQKAA